MERSKAIFSFSVFFVVELCWCHGYGSSVPPARLLDPLQDNPFGARQEDSEVKIVRSQDPFAPTAPSSNSTYYAGSEERDLDEHKNVESWWEHLEARKLVRIEQVKKLILKQAGLTHPANMSGFILPKVPSLLHQIDEINKKHMVRPHGEMQSDSAADQFATDPRHRPGNWQTAYFVAQKAPEWVDIAESPAVVFFNFSDQDPSALENANLSLWIHPAYEKLHKQNHPLKISASSLEDRRRRHSKKSRKISKNHFKKSSKVEIKIVLEVIVAVYNKATRQTDFKLVGHSFKDPLQSKQGHWIQLNVTGIVRKWLSEPSTNLGFKIRTITTGGPPMTTSGMFAQSDYLPVMELQLSPSPSDRKRRFARNRTCSGVAESICCRDHLIVSFVDLKWDWIVAPKSYESNMCRGKCPYLYAQQYAYSQVVKKTEHRDVAHFGACCSARIMDHLKMIYWNEKKIVVSDINDMVVVQCDCG